MKMRYSLNTVMRIITGNTMPKLDNCNKQCWPTWVTDCFLALVPSAGWLLEKTIFTPRSLEVSASVILSFPLPLEIPLVEVIVVYTERHKMVSNLVNYISKYHKTHNTTHCFSSKTPCQSIRSRLLILLRRKWVVTIMKMTFSVMSHVMMIIVLLQ